MTDSATRQQGRNGIRKWLPWIAGALALPSWLGLIAMACVVTTAMAQWDAELLRPFGYAVLYGTFVAGGISAILSAYLLRKEQRVRLFIFAWTPFVIVASFTLCAWFLSNLAKWN